jgi:hypothetical protein
MLRTESGANQNLVAVERRGEAAIARYLLQREKKERDDFEKGLERGVIPKPLPVYRAKPMKELGDDVKE